ncbi:MAG: sulfurtransferase [Betaproteobacteria bacterium]|nr:sulfurtransferase [Betaproteobacteria bacterium]
MASVLNIAAYQFVHLEDPVALRESLEAAAMQHQLKGTILLASEGINLFLAGTASGIAEFLADLRSDRRLQDLPIKESWSESVPFRKLRVRVKREIIRMNHPTIRPDLGRAMAVDASTLKRWLDAGQDDRGRPLLMLDTRNDFEVVAGRFQGARTLNLQKFSEFPQAVEQIRDELRDHAVVSYCTGGIRCEKAALYMNALGLTEHWQLEGGILKYFETVGGAHFEGSCTVFDERRALTSDLAARATDPETQCKD